MSTLIPRRTLAGLACLLLGSTSALAVDGKVFGDRVVEAFSSENAQVAYGNAEVEGENVTLTDMVVTSSGENIELGNVLFETVTGSNEAGWEVARVPFNEYANTAEGTSVTVGASVIEGLSIKGTAAGEAEMAAGVYFDRATVGPVSVEENGKTAFTLQGTEVANTETAGGGVQSNFNFGDFTVDFTAGETEDLAAISELGYSQIEGSISGSGSWTPADGELTLDAFDLDVDEAGRLSLAYGIDGYTPAFIQSLAQVQSQMASGGDSNAMGMAVLGLVSQLSLNSAEINYVDATFADKLLDYYAAQNNQSREDLVSSLVGALPLALGYLQNPEFQAEVASAVEAFLRDPQSLTISIEPEAPIAVTQIIGAAMGAPQTLPAVLSLSVTSNAAQ